MEKAGNNGRSVNEEVPTVCRADIRGDIAAFLRAGVLK